jgi:hypothetical protein
LPLMSKCLVQGVQGKIKLGEIESTRVYPWGVKMFGFL